MGVLSWSGLGRLCPLLPDYGVDSLNGISGCLPVLPLTYSVPPKSPPAGSVPWAPLASLCSTPGVEEFSTPAAGAMIQETWVIVTRNVRFLGDNGRRLTTMTSRPYYDPKSLNLCLAQLKWPRALLFLSPTFRDPLQIMLNFLHSYP